MGKAVAMARKSHDGPESPDSVGWTAARRVALADPGRPFELESGGRLDHLELEYETYGDLAPGRDNAVLVCHALSGDAHAAGWDREWETSGRRYRERKPGWWDTVIGPGKAVDTRRWHVICANVPGSCYGSTGPASIDPATGRPHGLRFPFVTVGDWVRTQAMLLDHLGIGRLHAVIGGSLGGQQALEWALAFPERVGKAAALAASARLSAQGLAFNAVGRYSIFHDPDFHEGDYYEVTHEGHHHHGLAAARMLAHITYLSEEGMAEKFGRHTQSPDQRGPGYGFAPEFAVESYLDHQGRAFVERFDANAYLYITRAMDYYDAAARWGEGDLAKAVERIRAQTLLASFSTDWLYPPAQCRELALAMASAGKPVTYVDVPSRFGHDAFLVEVAPVSRMLSGFLNA